jgi:hypothetical protein
MRQMEDLRQEEENGYEYHNSIAVNVGELMVTFFIIFICLAAFFTCLIRACRAKRTVVQNNLSLSEIALDSDTRRASAFQYPQQQYYNASPVQGQAPVYYSPYVIPNTNSNNITQNQGVSPFNNYNNFVSAPARNSPNRPAYANGPIAVQLVQKDGMIQMVPVNHKYPDIENI